eukprot:scaffold521_cov177-Ochromonas_danica.AAC.24
MGGGASVNSRYMGGKKLQRFYREDLYPTMTDLFHFLCIPESLGFAIFRVFVLLDSDESGLAQQEACYKFFHCRPFKFKERLFFCEIKEDNDTIIRTGFTYREFFIRIWSYCSLTVNAIARYLFEIFDPDHRELITKAQVGTIFRMLYNLEGEVVEEKDLAIYPFNQKDEIDKALFMEVSQKNPFLIQPAIQYQSYLRHRLGGRYAWETVSQYRKNHFFIYDYQSDNLQDACEAILHAAEDLHEKKQPISPEQSMRQGSLRIRKELDLTNQQLRLHEQQLEMERKQAALDDPSRPMRRAWQIYEARKAIFLETEYLTEDPFHRHEDRLALFTLLDEAIEESRHYYEWKDMNDLRSAEGTKQDHEAHYQDFIETEKGKIFHNTSGKDRENQWAALAMRHLKEEVEEVKKKKYASKKDCLRIEALVHEELSHSLQEKTIYDCKIDIENNKKQREEDYKKKELDLVVNYGSRITRWEFVLEKKSNRYYYMNVDTLELRHPKTAICERAGSAVPSCQYGCANIFSSSLWYLVQKLSNSQSQSTKFPKTALPVAM